MDVKIKVEMTPNPNALKFVTNYNVMNQDRRSFDAAEQCEGIPLAQELLNLEGVIQVHFFENVITITQNGLADWGELEERVKNKMRELLPTHDPNIILQENEGKSAVEMTPEMIKVNEILDHTIRPALQGDGGDLEVLALEENRLYVKYQGACGGCPSASMGTLAAIEGILRDQFRPDVEVHAM